MSLGLNYTTTVLGNGYICPISEMLGQRRLRQIESSSAEGRRLLRSGQVIILTSPGGRFTGVPIASVLDKLVERIQLRAEDPDEDPRGLENLRLVVDRLKQKSRSYS